MTVKFEPIAIVGEGLVLPGCKNSDDLWETVEKNVIQITTPSENRWRIKDPAKLANPNGGYIKDFASYFNPEGLKLSKEELQRLDPLFLWTIYAAKEALIQANLFQSKSLERAGLIMGNLCYPQDAFSELFETEILRKSGIESPTFKDIDFINRFNSGLPALYAKQALGLGGESFALDAACASGLYSIKLACDKLHSREADIMLAGSVNGSEQLFVHVGFKAFQALSRTGESMPFSSKANGLVSAEGSAFVVLKRYEDAVKNQDRILGVIRGISCSNDGKAGGFLSPSRDGQVECLRRTYELAGINPKEVSFVECHATGTVTGDTVELKTLREIFKENHSLYISSLKANLGHLVTASGSAGVIKILRAFEKGMFPSTPQVKPLNGEFYDDKFIIPEQVLPWKGRKLAAINSFGFGGNNAHMIIEESESFRRHSPEAVIPPDEKKVALIGVKLKLNQIESVEEFIEFFVNGTLPERDYEQSIEIDLGEHPFPPNDLKETFGQQLFVMKAANSALKSIGKISGLRTGVYMGMGTDEEVNRLGLSQRLGELLQTHASWIPDETKEEYKTKNFLPMTSAFGLGCMGNMVSNRVSGQYDFKGPCFAISSEELSGLDALKSGIDAISKGEIDLALVGAVDISAKWLHEKAVKKSLGGKIGKGADGVVIYVLKDFERAVHDKNEIMAVFEKNCSPVQEVSSMETFLRKELSKVGTPLAANGLFQLTAKLLIERQGLVLNQSGSLVPGFVSLSTASKFVFSEQFFGNTRHFSYQVRRPNQDVSSSFRIATFSGKTWEDLLANVEKARQRTEEGSEVRVSFIYQSEKEYQRKLARGLHLLRKNQLKKGDNDGIFFYPSAMQGEVAFAFTGAAAAYKGMGREFVAATPGLVASLEKDWKKLKETSRWIYDVETDEDISSFPFRELGGTTFLSQLHARWSGEILKLRPDAVLGLSSGETNSIFAVGVWQDYDQLFAEIDESRLYQKYLSGEYAAIKQSWGVTDSKISWSSYIVYAPVNLVRELLVDFTRVYLCIINTEQNCVIGGETAEVMRLLKKLEKHGVHPMKHDLAIHCPPVKTFEDRWYKIHHRKTYPHAPVKIYSNVFGDHYEPTSDNIAHALTVQAFQTIDFPNIVRKVHGDGVRIFVEHGPRNNLTTSIQEILKDEDVVVLSYDQAGVSSLKKVFETTAHLWALGAKVDIEKLKGMEEKMLKKMVFSVNRPPFVHLQEMKKEEIRSEKVLEKISQKEVRQVPTGVDHDLVIRLHEQRLNVHKSYLQTAMVSATKFQEMMRSTMSHLLKPSALPEIAVVPEIVVEKTRPGRKISREELEHLASNRISDVLGPEFKFQDDYLVQVRMPEPPLLLCDRVTGIDCPPLVLGKGTIWTETDVKEDSWYLHHGHMPAGVFIEAGQADLLLISYMGIDKYNQGEKAYRLLGCDLTFLGSLPKAGDTLRYEITIDAHLQHDETRLFLFHYDCYVGDKKITQVRNGQAGFFSKEELAHPVGVIWDPAEAKYSKSLLHINEHLISKKTSFSKTDIQNYLIGDMVACFGEQHMLTKTHTRTPQTPSGKLNFIHEIEAFEIKGGPGQRGYLRSKSEVDPNDWFFPVHFKNDPCMLGTLMADACLQMMSFYMIALGKTVHRDGWRFEPTHGDLLKIVCRAQVIPTSKVLFYEIFIDEILDDPYPTIYAHVLCTVDGSKAFLCERLGLQLVPAWPIESRQDLLTLDSDPKAYDLNGFSLDFNSLINCALGRPSHSFGPKLKKFDGPVKTPKLPGPPYHFMTRVIDLKADQGVAKNDSFVVAEYDIPEDPWYYRENGRAVMPYSVLMEIALQPCGWLSSFTLDEQSFSLGLLYRNLDGENAIQHRIVDERKATIRTKAKMVSFSKSGSLIIEKFLVESFIGADLIFSMETAFGFFDADSMTNQKGLPISEQDTRNLSLPMNHGTVLTTYPAKYFAGSLRLPSSKLLMLDEITAFHQKSNYMRATKKVRAEEWFFKAHFFQDPVQPGSLGVEAIIQLLQLYMIEKGFGGQFLHPVFEPVFIGAPCAWKYRGQVVPQNKLVTVDILVIEEEADAIMASANFWVDSLKIYHLPKIGMRIREGKVALPDVSEMFTGKDIKQRILDRHLPDVPLVDLTSTLIERFVDSLEFENFEDFKKLQGPALFLGNHQTALESFLFLSLMVMLRGQKVAAVSKEENARLWLGEMYDLGKRSMTDIPLRLIYFNRTDPQSFIQIYEDYLKEAKQREESLLIHVEGTRETYEGHKVSTMTGLIPDYAIKYSLPIIPIRFKGAFGSQGGQHKIDYPRKGQRQTIVIGKIIESESMKNLNSKERVSFITERINSLMSVTPSKIIKNASEIRPINDGLSMNLITRIS